MIFAGCFILLAIVKENRIQKLEEYSANLSKQIAACPAILSLAESPDAEEPIQAVAAYLKTLLDGSPFIEEISLLDRRFGKMPVSVSQSREVGKNGVIPRTSFSLNEILSSGEPFLSEDSWEYFIPLNVSNSYRAVLRMRWLPEATWKYFYGLRTGVAYFTAASFAFHFLFSYLVLLRVISREQSRLVKTLSSIVNGDCSGRIDTRSFSKGLAEIGVYLNRMLAEMEQERKTASILDDTLRQTERGCSDYRKSLLRMENELKAVRQEMQDGLIALFESIWCGVMVIDSDYIVHSSNELSDRLLRFAKVENGVIVDERLRRCLEPMIRLGAKKEIDDLCVWPQTAMNRSVSCRIRSLPVPTGDGSRLFFLLLREESGYPKHLSSNLLLERLVLDCVAGEANPLRKNSVSSPISRAEIQFKRCLRRIEALRHLENGNAGAVQPIRLPYWIREHLQAEDLFSDYLHIDANTPNMDIQIHAPERVFQEMMECLISILSYWASKKDDRQQNANLAVRALLDSRGKPVLTFMISDVARNHAGYLHDLLDERVGLSCEDKTGSLSVDELEQDICLSLFRVIKNLLRIQMECVYTESKRMVTLRFTIDNHAFPPPSSDEAELTYSDTVRDLVRNFMNGA
ncbi:MAG: hypothetical protein AB1656_06515 [Candidatus Omnitrophota bacterium]